MPGTFEKGILEGKILLKIFDKNRLCTRWFEKVQLYWAGGVISFKMLVLQRRAV